MEAPPAKEVLAERFYFCIKKANVHIKHDIVTPVNRFRTSIG
tara:strand:- start:2200 stop:2325 length:126 start_codon:yes stop_codon:yes gene_type:complete